MKLTGDKSIIVKNGLLFTVAPFLPKIINVVLLPIMTKYLTDVDFGISGTISAYTQSIGAFVTLGLTVVLQNSFFKTPLEYKDIWRQIYGFLKLWMIIYAIAQSVILYFFIPEQAIENRWWIIILSQFSTVLFGPTGTIGSSYYIYSKQSFPVVWRSVVASLLTILVDFVLIVFLRWGYMGWYVGSFVGIFFTNASYWKVVNDKLGLKPNYHINWRFLKKALSVGIPTIPHYYTNYLLEGSGRIVMNQDHIPQGDIGQISVTQQMGDLFIAGTTGLNNAISPYQMESLRNKNGQRINYITTIFTLIIFALAFVLAIWSKEIFRLLLSNKSLQISYPYFILYVMALCYRPLYLNASNYYFYFERTKQLLMITFLSGCIALALYIAFIPILGIWAFLIGHYISCLYFGYSGYFYKGYRENTTKKLSVIWFLVIQLILTILAFVLVEYFLIKVLVTAILVIVGTIGIIKHKNLFDFE